MKTVSRREFLLYLAGAAGAAVLTRGIAQAASKVGEAAQTKPASAAAPKRTASGKRVADGLDTQPVKGAKFALAIDVGACIGCRRCQYACKAENNIPDTIAPAWIEVFGLKDSVDLTGHASMEDLRQGATTSYTESPQPGMWYMPAQCNHCDNAPCVQVCPTGATYKAEDGYVLMDYGKCVGCRFCVVACPYNARRFNWVLPRLNEKDINPQVPVRPVGVVEKCTFCVHRTREGKLPRCVEVCPVGARHFGNLNDPGSEVSRLLQATPSFRLLEELNTEPSIHYVTRGRKFVG